MGSASPGTSSSSSFSSSSSILGTKAGRQGTFPNQNENENENDDEDEDERIINASLDAFGHGLRLQAKFRRAEGVLLGHRMLGAVQTVENELAKKRISDLSVAADMALAVMVDQIKLITFVVPAYVEIFAQLDVSRRAEDKGPAIPPGAQTIRVQPVNANIVCRAIVRDQVGLAPIFELRKALMMIIGDLRIEHARARCARVIEELLELV